MVSKEIENRIKCLGDIKIAKHSQRFFKTAKGEYGFGDKFLGIRVPIIRQEVKKYKNISLDVTKKLLKSEYHEIRLFALLVLVHQFSNASDDERYRIYKLYLNNTQNVNNWDLVDSSAPHIVGAFLEDKEKFILYKMSKSESLWERRISIIATHHFIKHDQYKDTIMISKTLLNDKEDLIHKAVGWMLREVGNREKKTEVKFLNKYYQKMPRTMLRYAIEKFDELERQKYLNGKI